jgi:hypothetical protein
MTRCLIAHSEAARCRCAWLCKTVLTALGVSCVLVSFRNWHCGRVCGVTFNTLCKHMMKKGVINVETRGYTVVIL